MPYRSDAQRRFMHARHPEIAKRWDAEYGGGGNLPEHVPGAAHAAKRKAIMGLKKMKKGK